MTDIYNAINRVMSTPEFTPPGDMAKTICGIRQVNPYEQVYVHGYSMMMWQAVMVECAMSVMMLEMLR